MAIVRDATKSVDMVLAGSSSTSFTVTTAGKGRVLWAFQTSHGALSDDPIYAGQTMDVVYSGVNGSIYYYICVLLNPSTGTNTYNAPGAPLNYGSGVVLVSYTGEDVSSVTATHGILDQHNDSGGDGTLGPFNYSSETDELVLCAVFYNSGDSGGNSGIIGPTETGQVEIGNVNITRGGSGYIFGDVALSETPGDTTVSQGWTFDWDGGVHSFTFSLKPLKDYVSRAVEYSVDAFDPDQIIYDSEGNPVDRWAIHANEWIRVTGLEFPQAVHYETFYEDPSLAYIEAVQYDADSDSVSITTNRGELPEVILARATAGGTG